MEYEPEKINEKLYMQYLKNIQNIIQNINEDNINKTVDELLGLYNDSLFSFNIIIIRQIYSSYISQHKNINIYLQFLQLIEAKEKEVKHKITNVFTFYMLSLNSQESNYILENMINQKMIDKNFVKRKKSLYFIHYNTKEEINDFRIFGKFTKEFSKNIKKLSNNDWELHKQLIKEGRNTNEIAKIIRNDEIEKLQEISSQTNFDFNQTIEPSLYEICSFINKENVTLIDYAAFFGSVKCFKFLMLNYSKLTNTCKYAIAGGNLEIFHLCEKNNKYFTGAYESAIEFHRNDIFRYLYENKICIPKDVTNLGKLCILYNNYEVLSFLEDKIELNPILNETAKVGNIFLFKYFLNVSNQIPKNILISASFSGNYELVKFILEEKINEIDIKNLCFEFKFFSLF